MHKYLRAIGFSQFDTRKKVKALVEACAKDPSTKEYVESEDNAVTTVFCKDFAENIGIAVYGEFDEDNQYIYDYYIPYMKGTGITSIEDITIERHAEKESYAGICDDVKVGVTLIFYLINMIDYLKLRKNNGLPARGTTLTLSGLSCQGMILMPIVKNNREKEKIKNASLNRNQLIEAARRGNEEAIESLTLEDMDTYSNISRKILKEDVYTLVDTSFMPYGVECDHYSILGEIIECEQIENRLTKEKLYQMKINCNELTYDICINAVDLLGEPMIGRRFKGIIWLQGTINFPEL